MRAYAFFPFCLGAGLALATVALACAAPASVTPIGIALATAVSAFMVGVAMIAKGRALGWAAAFGGLLTVAYVSPSLAADGAAGVAIPWGEWLAGGLAWSREAILGLALAGLGLLVRKLPGQAGALVEGLHLDALLTRAVDYAIAAVSGATRGRATSVALSNQVLEEALRYVVANAPGLAARYSDTLRAKLLARISAAGVVAPEASAAALGVTLPAK